jgi:hypothetical protein
MKCGHRKWHNLNFLIQSLYFWFHTLELNNVLLTEMSIYVSHICYKFPRNRNANTKMENQSTPLNNEQVQLHCNYKRNKKLALEVHRITDDTSLREITFVTAWHTRAGHSPLHHSKARAYTRLLSSLYFHNISNIPKK